MNYRTRLVFFHLLMIFLLSACSSKPVRPPYPYGYGNWTPPPQSSIPPTYYPLYRDNGPTSRPRNGSDFDVFPRPADIEPQVSFWRKVYSKWGRSEVAIHDKVHMDIIYDVFELPGETSDILTPVQKDYLQDRFHSWKSRLSTLEDKLAAGMPLNAQENELVQYFAQKTGRRNAILGASEQLRYQRGLKERFQRGLEISRRYDYQFRQIFRNAGLPEDLAYLPHVESSFQYNAHSSAGALGIWQFTAGAAKIFMNGNSSAEARLDPIASTRGAARYLAAAYEKLGSWPLAITSYNHGIGGMQRARNIYGHDFMSIVKQYNHPQFGFASRNYYAEFLAAKDVASDPQRYFAEASDDVNYADVSNPIVGNESLSPAPEPQEPQQVLETLSPPTLESADAGTSEADTTESQWLATEPKPAESIVQAEAVEAAPLQIEPSATEPQETPVVLAETESSEADEAEPSIPERPTSAKTARPARKKIEKPTLATEAKKNPIVKSVNSHQSNPPAMAYAKKSAIPAMPVAQKTGLKHTTTPYLKPIGKTTTASAKPIHASFKQDNRPIKKTSSSR